MDVTFNGFQCYIEFGQYGNGNTAILLKDHEDDGTVAVATTNTGTEVPENIVAVKDWSENSGMVATLAAFGVIETKPYRSEEVGFVQIEFFPLTARAFQELEKQKKGANQNG